MGPQHIRGGVLFAPAKTGVSLSIPVHQPKPLRRDTSQWLFSNDSGRSALHGWGLSNWFREMCNQAGLPKGTSAHGLRKAACRRLAEAGCSANVIAAISGHKSLQEIQRYTMAADQMRMAHAGIDAMQSSDRTKNTKLQT
jgi:site-specific recombinase XerD